MAIDCSKIINGFVTDSCKFAVPGTGGRVILVNFSDVDKSKATFVTGDDCSSNVLSNFPLKEGAVGYEVDSVPNASVGSVSVNAGTYLNIFIHQVIVRLFQKSEAAKCFINGSLNARVMAIVQNNATGDEGETKYEVYGWEAGMKVSDLTAGTDMSDNIVYEATFATADGDAENYLPLSIFSTDEATTDALIDSLLA